MLTIGVWLRLPSKEGYSAYAYQELSRDLSVIKNIANGNFPLHGPQSSLNNFHFGPIYYYLYFPLAYIFCFTPYSLAVTSLFFSILTILLGFFIIKSWGKNNWLAILFVFIMTFSMGDIQFAKYGSNPNIIPFFAILFFYSLKNLYDNHEPLLNTFILSISFGVATQLHIVPLICLSIILIISIITKKIKIKTKNLSIFILTNLILYFPYILYEATNNFYDLKQLIVFTQGTGYSASFFSRLGDFVGFLISPVISTNNFFNVPILIGTPFICLIVALMLLISPAMHLDKKLSIKEKSYPKIESNLKIILKLWFVVPAIVLLMPINNIVTLHPYYFFMLSPLLFFVYTILIYKLFLKGWRVTAAYLLFLFLVLQLVQYVYYQKFFNI